MDIESTPDKDFILDDGHRIKTLRELKLLLPKMDPKTFQRHVNENRNDFANWTKEVFGAEEVADRMLRTRNSIDLANAIFI